MFSFAACFVLLSSCATSPQPSLEFEIVEATIAEIHQAMEDGRLTSRSLVEAYLRRIEAFDKKGSAINSIVMLNPGALARADELDAAFARSGLTGPLHGIPFIVKDNYEVEGLPVTAGSLSLSKLIAPDDAFQVRRIRQAGAIVLAKSNMAEFAFSPYHSVGSALPGHTRNPYALNRVPAGSSGGTAAAVAANLGAVGLGTDTGNSIRGPSSHCMLVGIRSTMGLTSRDGIIPLYLDHDIGGPMARSVADAALVLGVIAGYDEADSATEAAKDRSAVDYLQSLDAKALSGARIGVVRQIFNREGVDAEVLTRFEEALETMRRQGAEVVDAERIVELDEIPSGAFWCSRFKADLESYLASVGEAAPVRTLAEVIESGQFHPLVGQSLQFFARQPPPSENPGCSRSVENGQRLRQGVRRVLQEQQLDALAFPTWSHPPRLIGDLNTPHGDNSQQLSPHTGFPAITVPMGTVGEGLPTGLQLVGDAWSEARLIALAYAFEQATKHRRPPDTAPPL